MPLCFFQSLSKSHFSTHINHLGAIRGELYCWHQTAALLSPNVLLIVLPITTNNASDKINQREPLSWCRGFHRKTPCRVNTPLWELTLSQHTWAHQRLANASRVNTLTPVEAFEHVFAWTRKNSQALYLPLEPPLYRPSQQAHLTARQDFEEFIMK